MGVVVKLDFEGHIKRVKFHFPKMQIKHDEWIEIYSSRIAPLHSNTTTPSKKLSLELLSMNESMTKRANDTPAEKKLTASDSKNDSKSSEAQVLEVSPPPEPVTSAENTAAKKLKTVKDRLRKLSKAKKMSKNVVDGGSKNAVDGGSKNLVDGEAASKMHDSEWLKSRPGQNQTIFAADKDHVCASADDGKPSSGSAKKHSTYNQLKIRSRNVDTAGHTSIAIKSSETGMEGNDPASDRIPRKSDSNNQKTSPASVSSVARNNLDCSSQEPEKESNSQSSTSRIPKKVKLGGNIVIVSPKKGDEIKCTTSESNFSLRRPTEHRKPSDINMSNKQSQSTEQPSKQGVSKRCESAAPRQLQLSSTHRTDPCMESDTPEASTTVRTHGRDRGWEEDSNQPSRSDQASYVNNTESSRDRDFRSKSDRARKSDASHLKNLGVENPAGRRIEDHHYHHHCNSRTYKYPELEGNRDRSPGRLNLPDSHEYDTYLNHATNKVKTREVVHPRQSDAGHKFEPGSRNHGINGDHQAKSAEAYLKQGQESRNHWRSPTGAFITERYGYERYKYNNEYDRKHEASNGRHGDGPNRNNPEEYDRSYRPTRNHFDHGYHREAQDYYTHIREVDINRDSYTSPWSQRGHGRARELSPDDHHSRRSASEYQEEPPRRFYEDFPDGIGQSHHHHRYHPHEDYSQRHRDRVDYGYPEVSAGSRSSIRDTANHDDLDRLFPREHNRRH